MWNSTCVRLAALTCAFLALPALAAPDRTEPHRVAVLRLRQAIESTKEGQKRIAELAADLSKRQNALKQEQAEIDAMKTRLADEGGILNAEAKQNLSRDIEAKSRQLQREIGDLQWDSQDRQMKLYNEIGSRMRSIIADYAKKNNFVLVIDASNPTASVTWASAVVNITGRIVQQYDQVYPADAAPASPAPAK